MGLLSEILLLPLAPVRGSIWVLDQVVADAERQYYDPSAIQAQLAALEKELEAGDIDEETFDRREDELLDRLEGARTRQTGTTGQTGT
ncbi:gas vesicle protein [Streptomyces sp. SID8379]|uniref:gas vesicle protein GvpG n=1 Tax=unclassified Streptomyces TaxID=2593676 RepID=UPI00037609A7|nr:MULTISPECIES: gas vesicle protein GvpG [unclassified Streptomyces]MYW69358.1 gas vesicle protein [Streptomyces sp. SID8379]MYW69407.1 gas vesicle protein [Streptomyces sp. SID8379]